MLRKKVLIAGSSGRFNQAIKITLDLSFDFELVEVKDLDRVQTVLEQLGTSCSMIIYRLNKKDFNIDDLLVYIDKKSKHKPIFLCVTDADSIEFNKKIQPYPFAHIVTEEIFLPHFVDIVKKISSTLPEKDEQYQSISIDAMGLIDGLDNDLFVRLSSGNFVKVFKEGSSFSAQDLQRLKDQEVKLLWIKAPVAQNMKEQVSRQYNFFLKFPGFKFVVRSPDDPLHKRFEAKIIKCQDHFLIDSQFKNQIEETINKTLDMIMNQAVMDQFLKKLQLKKNERSYLPEHMFLLTYVLVAWSIKIGWHSTGTKEKLVYAAILHDITLAGYPHLAEISDYTKFKAIQKTLSSQEQEVYLQHPMAAAHLVNDFFKQAPPDVATIILQHHELPNGKGFPSQLNWSKLSPLTNLFLLAHEYVDFLLQEEDPQLEDFLLKISATYSQNQYQTFLKVLNEINTKIAS